MADSEISLKQTAIVPILSRRYGKLRADHSQEKGPVTDLLYQSRQNSTGGEQGQFAILKCYEEIESLLPEWRDLFSEMQSQDTGKHHLPPFSRPDVLACWAKAAESEMDSLFVITLRTHENGKLRAVFPGFLYRGALRMLTDDVTDYQDITALSRVEAEVMMSEVINISQIWRYRLALHKISDFSLAWDCLQAVSRSNHYLVKRPHGPCPHGDFEIPRGGGDFLNTLSKKRRKNHKAAASKIRQRIPEGRVEHLRGEEITREVIAEISDLHISNQYRKQGESVFKKQTMRDWLLNIAKVDSSLNIALFRDGDELAAFNLSFVDIEQKTFYYYIPSFSREYQNYSLGTWLMVESLRHHTPANGGNFRLDLLCGDENYKKMWATDRYHVWRVILFPGNISSRAAYGLYRGVYALKTLKNKLISTFKERSAKK